VAFPCPPVRVACPAHLDIRHHFQHLRVNNNQPLPHFINLCPSECDKKLFRGDELSFLLIKTNVLLCSLSCITVFCISGLTFYYWEQ
jgi:hypothetical protein